MAVEMIIFSSTNVPPFYTETAGAGGGSRAGAPDGEEAEEGGSRFLRPNGGGGCKEGREKVNKLFFVETFTAAKRFGSPFPIFCPIDLNFSSFSTFVHIFFDLSTFLLTKLFSDLPNTIWNLM